MPYALVCPKCHEWLDEAEDEFTDFEYLVCPKCGEEYLEEEAHVIDLLTGKRLDMITLKVAIRQFESWTEECPEYYDDGLGTWFGEYDAWLLRLGLYFKVIDEARKQKRTEEDSVEDIVKEVWKDVNEMEYEGD